MVSNWLFEANALVKRAVRRADGIYNIGRYLVPKIERIYGVESSFLPTVGTAFLVLVGVLLWRGHELFATAFGAIGGTLFLAGLVIPGFDPDRCAPPDHRREPGVLSAQGWGLLASSRSGTPPLGPSTTVLTGFDMAKTSLGAELWAYFKVRKKWWLLPIVVLMLMVGSLIVFAQGSALAPFIYTLF